MKEKIISFIFYIFAFYFIIFTIFSWFIGCYNLSDYLLEKFNIIIPVFALEILGFIGLGCLCTIYVIEKEKRENK